MTDAPTMPLDELSGVLAAPARLRILQELLGGQALSAGVLAARTGTTPSTTSLHLGRLQAAGLIVTESQGRARLSRLAHPLVAEAVESLLRLTDEEPVTSLRGHDARAALREARSCYDHLAGRLGVAVADLAVQRGWVVDDDGSWRLGDEAWAAAGAETGLVLADIRSSRPAVRPCLDWTERRAHLAGRFGRSILDAMAADGWVRRRRDGRALTVTALGRERLARLGIV